MNTRSNLWSYVDITLGIWRHDYSFRVVEILEGTMNESWFPILILPREMEELTFHHHYHAVEGTRDPMNDAASVIHDIFHKNHGILLLSYAQLYP